MRDTSIYAITAIHRTDSPAILHLDFNFQGRCIGRFEIPVEFYVEHMDTSPAPDPFQVVEALIDHLHAYGCQEVVLALHIQEVLNQYRHHVMSIWLYGELAKVVGERRDMQQQLADLREREIDLRERLQSLPICRETEPAEEYALTETA
jgi:hypothetical protein